jgi:sugar/nucleoside kinase (ribokinase family)
MYFGIGQQIEVELTKIEATLQHAKGAGVLIEMDSNYRSYSWHDTATKTSGRNLVEFLINKQLHVMK